MIEFVHEDFERVITIFYMYKKVDLSMLSRDMKNIKTASIKFLEIKKSTVTIVKNTMDGINIKQCSGKYQRI